MGTGYDGDGSQEGSGGTDPCFPYSKRDGNPITTFLLRIRQLPLLLSDLSALNYSRHGTFRGLETATEMQCSFSVFIDFFSMVFSA